MRSTIHVVPRRDCPLLAAGIRRSRRAWWLRVSKLGEDRAVRRAADRVRELLADGPRTRAELFRELGVDAHVWNGLGLRLDLVRVPPTGTWSRRRADGFATAEQWLGPAPEVSEEATEEATEEDGLGLFLFALSGGVGAAVATRRRVVGRRRDRLVRPCDRACPASAVHRRARRRAPGRAPRTAAAQGHPALVRLLPTWDAVLLVQARHTGIPPKRYRPRVFSSRTPHSFSTFLIDGLVAGT
jgi:Winged helix DNA-binding domain